MKKHDEGYILAYVFVILVVICLLATSVLTVPLVNLRMQKASVERMKNQYAAQGRIEQMLARLDSARPQEGHVQKTIALNEALAGEDVEFEVLDVKLQPDLKQCEVSFETAEGSVQVTCVLKITCADIGQTPGADGVLYTLYAPEYEYVSYTFSSVSDTEGGDENAA